MRMTRIVVSVSLFGSILWAQERAQQEKTAALASNSTAATVTADAKKQASVTSTPESQTDLVVTRAAIAPELQDNEPVEAADAFPADVRKLYCFSQIKGASDSTTIEHRWYWNDDLVLSIPLSIRSVNWRTYSAKTIYPGMKGEWIVSIVNAQKEKVLKTLKFRVE